MARLVVWNVVTLDGCFEGSRAWDLTFHNSVWCEELDRFSDEQLASASALLFGRRTYEGMAAYWPGESGRTAGLMNAARKYVFSRTLGAVDWSNSLLMRGDATDSVRALKDEIEGAMLVLGSAELTAALLHRGLVDEYRLCIAPVLLGAGTRLFNARGPLAPLSLLQARVLVSGAILACYAPARPEHIDAPGAGRLDVPA